MTDAGLHRACQAAWLAMVSDVVNLGRLCMMGVLQEMETDADESSDVFQLTLRASSTERTGGLLET